MATTATAPGGPQANAPELRITRSFDAPAALVFKAWTQAEHLVRWLGPLGFAAREVELDCREGGRWRACISAPEHGDSWMGGTYREVSPPNRLVFTFAWESTGFETLVTIDLEAVAGRTVMTFHQAPFVSVDSRDSHDGGWRSSFDRLAQHLASPYA